MAPFKNTAGLKFNEDPSYRECLADQLCSQRKQGLFCDLYLIVEELSVPVHKNVLVAKSDYFAAMFSQKFCEESAKFVDMSHVFPSIRILELILDYVYTGAITLNEDTVDEVLQSANHLLLEPLGKHCAQYLLSNLAPENCVHTWALADAYCMTELAFIAKSMTKSRLQDCIIKDEGSLQIPGHFLLKLLKEAMPDIMNIEYLLSFLRRWSRAGHREDCFEVLENLLACYPDLSHHLTKLWIDLKREAIKNIYDDTNNNDYRTTSDIDVGSLVDTKLASTELLLSYKLDRSSKPGDTRIQCYAYHPRAFLWLKFGTICTSFAISDKDEAVGLTNEFLIYNIKTRHPKLLALSLVNTENKEIPYPERHSENIGLVTYKPFCFNQKLFCIVEDERRSNHLKRRTRFHEADFITARNLLVYDSRSKSWRFCCQIPLEGSYGGQQATLDYHIIDSGDVAYIWAMDMYWHESGPGGGPFWMKLSPPVSKYVDEFMYCISLENGPPITSQEWGYKQVKILGSGERICVYGYSYHCNMCTPMLMYSKETSIWETQEELVMHYPNITLPLHGEITKPETIYISQKSSVQSLSTGLIFHLEDLCPFINKFWALDLVSIEWKELPAPPANGLKSFLSCRVQNAVLARAEHASYEEYKGDVEGPLLHGRLPQSAGCFQQVAPSEDDRDSEEEFLLERGHDYKIGESDGEEGEWDCFFDALSDFD